MTTSNTSAPTALSSAVGHFYTLLFFYTFFFNFFFKLHTFFSHFFFHFQVWVPVLLPRQRWPAVSRFYFCIFHYSYINIFFLLCIFFHYTISIIFFLLYFFKMYTSSMSAPTALSSAMTSGGAFFFVSFIIFCIIFYHY